MAGLLRNILVMLRAMLRHGRCRTTDRLTTCFRVTPLDIGLWRLKSDRYLQLTEAAQIDFVIRTGLIGTLLKHRYNFVNASVLVRYAHPITLMAKVSVQSQIIYHDTRFAYFEHRFRAADTDCACVLVKMKFKKGRLTVEPGTILGTFGAAEKPETLQQWDALLARWP